MLPDHEGSGSLGHRRHRRDTAQQLTVFPRRMAVAYVFLHVLPDLGTAFRGAGYGDAHRARSAEASFTPCRSQPRHLYGLERRVKLSRAKSRSKGQGDQAEGDVLWLGPGARALFGAVAMHSDRRFRHARRSRHGQRSLGRLAAGGRGYRRLDDECSGHAAPAPSRGPVCSPRRRHRAERSEEFPRSGRALSWHSSGACSFKPRHS